MTTSTNSNAAAPASAPATPASPATLGFGGASKLLKHQLKTGRMFTAGSGQAADAPAAASAPAPVASQAPASAPAATPRGFGSAAARAPQSAPSPATPAERPAAAPQGFSAPGAPRPESARAAPAPAPRPAGNFTGALNSMRESEAAKVHISTVKLLTRLLGAVATRPGIMADEKVRSDTLRGLHMQAMDLGGAIAQRCVPGAPVPDWLRAQAVDAAAGALCMAWEGGLSADSIARFNDSLAQQIGAIAQEGEAIAGRVGFDGYVAADSPETAQARLYVSITAAIGRITVLGFPPSRAAECIGQVVEQLEASPNYAGMKLDLRTAWLQGSLGRCTDLMIAVLESKALVTGGEDRLAFAQRQALSLIQEVETYAHSLIQRKYGNADAAHAEGSDPEPGSVPRAG